MKKIDLHTHTVSTVSDYPFDFDLSKVKEYVEKLKIDALAIFSATVSLVCMPGGLMMGDPVAGSIEQDFTAR